MTEAERIEPLHPDFPEWKETEIGKKCTKWPISEEKYLHNRLFWAFDAGRNYVWQQYITQKSENEHLCQLIKEKDEEINTLESQQDVMAADTVRLLDQIEYQNKAVKEDHDKISKLEFELKSAQELNRELVKVLKRSLEPLNSTSEYFAIQNEIKSLINKSK